MKRIGLVLLGAACVLALCVAYLAGRVHGAAPRLDARLASSEPGAAERFWRLEVELASGARREAPGAVRAPLPSPEAREPEEPVRRAAPQARAERRDTGQLAALVQRDDAQALPNSVNGPLLEAWYGEGRPQFRGTQVQDADGRWQREGPWEAWHENGTLHELGAYQDDVETGRWQWWYENGVHMAEGTFQAGEKVGPWTFWHENGEPMMEGRYAGGERTGHWIYYHENGLKAAEGDFVDGKASGAWTMWFPDGTVDPERSGTYRNGERTSGAR